MKLQIQTDRQQGGKCTDNETTIRQMDRADK